MQPSKGLVRTILLVLGSLVPWTVASGIQLECEERCQFFDDFTGECLYRVRCDWEPGCVTETSCERWDDFTETCLSDTSTKTCEFWRPFPDPGRVTMSCTTRCQYFDDFTRRCKYRTRCEWQEQCVTATSCERWDSFLDRCQSERRRRRCL